MIRRNVGLFLVIGVVLPLAFAAGASAQGSVLLVTPSTATPGQQVTITGGNFSAAAGNSPVTIRLETRSGQIINSPIPDSLGNINTTFPLPPNITPGWHLLVATQTTDANGRQRAFTPGRTRILIQPAAASKAGVAGAGGISPLALGTIGMALIALLGGTTLLTRRRLARRPQLGSQEA